MGGPCSQTLEEPQRLGDDGAEDVVSSAAEERRGKARASLKQAMHRRRLEELRAAIAEAEAAELYTVELEYARSIMDEALKTAARESLKAACESRSVAALNESIGEALHAELPPEQIRSAEEVLLEEIEKGHSRHDLSDALQQGTLEHLLAAVSRGEAAGLTPLELDRAKSAIKIQERKADARQGLASAVQERDIEKMKKFITDAKMARLMPSESELAKETLAQELRKVDARAGLRAADILRQGGDVEAFRAAVQEGQEAGLEVSELSNPLEVLAMEDLKISARKNLEFARTGGKGTKLTKERVLEITRQAVSEGEAAGLEPADLAEARELLVEAEKADARVVLANACKSCDVATIHAAIAYGEKVGLNKLAFHDAHLAIMSAETKGDVLARMAKALAGRKIFEMKGAIRDGMNIQLPESEFVDLKLALAEEVRKANARKQLQADIDIAVSNQESRELIIHELDVAIAEGEAAGLADDEIQPARRQVLLTRQHIAKEALLQAIKLKNIELLQEAIAGAEKVALFDDDVELAKSTLAREERRKNAFAALKAATKSLDQKELREAISEGEKSVAGSKELIEAKKVLKEQERRTEARNGLLESIVSRKIDKLNRWIGKAEGAGLQYQGKEGKGSDEYTRAKIVLAEEERKVAARVALKAAERSRSIPELRKAAQEGAAADLEDHELEHAKAALAEVLPQAARAGLEKALASRSVKDLKASIKEGVAVGLDASELNQPRLALGEEQLVEALRRKAVFEIRRAIEYGEAHGVDALALENARQVLTVEEKKETARKWLRDSEASCRIDEIMAAMGSGRAAGLESWEFDFANKVVEEERRRLMARPMRSR